MSTDWEIRKGRKEDVNRILEIYSSAKSYMRKTGNLTQWSGNYPSKELVEEDIETGICHVLTISGEVHGVFVFFLKPDPTYTVIENGNWRNDEPYGTIHRIASDGRAAGVLSAAVKYALGFTDNLRMDTHHDNRVMQQALERQGFRRCGIIYLENKDPRIAYQLVKES